MPDRVNYLTVGLEKNMREEDVEALVQAIRCMRGVLDCKPNIVDSTCWVAETRAKQELMEKIFNVFK